MKKNRNGFTLIELLAVIVILGIILVIATTNIIKSINASKIKARYTAAKEIVQISEAYFAINSEQESVKISNLTNYLESDATNPKTGKNDLISSGGNQCVIRNSNYSSQSGYDTTLKSGKNGYEFDGYFYSIDDCD